jgi:hypothetical protein
LAAFHWSHISALKRRGAEADHKELENRYIYHFSQIWDDKKKKNSFPQLLQDNVPNPNLNYSNLPILFTNRALGQRES